MYLLAVFLFSSAGTLSAQDNFANRYALGLNAGTTGIGGEITTNMTKKIAIRFGLNTLSYGDSGIYDDDEPSVDEDADSDTADGPTVIYLLTILPPIMLTTLTVVHGAGVRLTLGLTVIER